MLKFTLVLIAACLPGIASELTFTAEQHVYTDPDSPNLPFENYVVLPGFNPSLGTLEAVDLTSTFILGTSLSQPFDLELGSNQQDAAFSFNYSPSLQVSGPYQYSNGSIVTNSPGLAALPDLSGNVALSGLANLPGPLCCDLPIAPYFALIPVSTEFSDSYAFSDLDPFTSDDFFALVFQGQFGGFPGSPHYWDGDYAYQASITYTYASTPEPSLRFLLSIILLALACAARTSAGAVHECQ
jgi:hypothetical protein